MPTLVGFGAFASLPQEQISERISRRILSGDQGMIVWWSIGAGVHVEPHSHANEQIVWMLTGKNMTEPETHAVAPGPIWTPLIPSTMSEEAVAKFGKNVPMKRPGQPAERRPT